MELGCRVQYVKKRLYFDTLTHLLKEFSLPMMVSLKLDSNGLGNEHVIGICPHIASKGIPVQIVLLMEDSLNRKVLNIIWKTFCGCNK